MMGCGSKKDKAFVVGMDLSYPPFETIDAKGQPIGISVELAKALAAELERPLKIENIPFVGLLPSLNNGRVDCVISSMTVTEERKRAIDFSKPYLKTGLALLTARTFEGEIDRPDRTVVVRQGTTGEVWARRTLKQAGILAVEKESSAVLEVIQGKADAFVYDQMSVWKHAKETPGKLQALLEPVQVEEWAIGVKSGNTVLLQKINQFLESFRASGGFDRLSKEFLPEQQKAFQEQGVPFVF